MEILKKDELYYLEKLIERLNNEIKLESKTLSDLSLSIQECLYQRAYGRTVQSK